MPRRSGWFWAACVWLALMMVLNLYDELHTQGGASLGHDLGNVIDLVLLLWLTFRYPRSHRWVAGIMGAFGVLAVIFSARDGIAELATGVVDLTFAVGLYLRPFRTGPRPAADDGQANP